MRRTLVVASVLALGTLIASSCGGDDSSSKGSSDAVTVTGAWVRSSSIDKTAAYFTITSPKDDKLTGVAVDASVAAKSELHQTTAVTGSTMAGTATTMMGAAPATTMAGSSSGSMSGSGEMMMTPVSAIDLPAGTAVALKPGGYHVMLTGLAKALKVGDSVTLTLSFTTAPAATVTAPVLDAAP